VIGLVTDDEVLALFPRVRIDRDNLEHYRGLAERRLLLHRCADCANWHHPPRRVCPRCWSNAISAEEVSGRGTVALRTVIRQGPSRSGLDYSAGHVVVAVDLEEQAGLRVSGSIVGGVAAGAEVGSPVELCWTEREGAPTVAFRPIGKDAA
jgi:uncharacterized protein